MSSGKPVPMRVKHIVVDEEFVTSKMVNGRVWGKEKGNMNST